MRRKKLKKGIRIFLIVVLLGIFSFVSYRLVSFYLDLHKNKEIHQNLLKDVLIHGDTDDNEDSLEIDFDRLLEINNETKAWIRFNQNKVNYPVLQRKNNVYYLYRAIDGSVNSAGSIFMDYRNNSFDDRNVVLYGHNMVDGTMFGSLEDVFKDGFFDTLENQYIEIILPGNIHLTYQIFSYYMIEKEEYYITTSFNNDTNFDTFLQDMKKRSLKEFDVSLTTSDKILTLSTCHGSGGTTKRKVVHAKRVEI